MGRLSHVRGRLKDVLPVGTGLVAVGLSSYGLLAVASHNLTPAAYAAVGSLFLLTNILGVGVFHAVEQEVNREVSARSAAGTGSGSVVRTALVVCGCLVVVVLAALGIAGPVLIRDVFASSTGLLAAAAIGVVGSAALYTFRGTLAGHRRYGWYASSMIAEGGARLLLAAALALIGIGDVEVFGLCLVGAFLIAVVPTALGLRGDRAGPPAPWRPMAGRVLSLVGTLGMTYLVANLAPVVLTAQLPGERAALAAAFVSAFVLTRAPVFLFAPVQAFLLPAVMGALERGEAGRIRQQVGLLVGAVLLVGVGAGGVIVAAGPWITRIFLNSQVDLDRSTFAILVASVVVMMVAQVLQPVLLGLGRHHHATAAWTLGTFVFLAVLFGPLEPLTAAVIAQLAGPVCVVVAVLVSYRSGLRDAIAAGPRAELDETVKPSS